MTNIIKKVSFWKENNYYIKYYSFQNKNNKQMHIFQNKNFFWKISKK